MVSNDNINIKHNKEYHQFTQAKKTKQKTQAACSAVKMVQHQNLQINSG